MLDCGTLSSHKNSLLSAFFLLWSQSTKTFSLSKIDLFFPIYTYPVKLVSWKLVPSLNATGRCVLFIVKPDLTEESSITLPFYVAILNAKDEVVDMQYYQVDGDLKGEPENANYIETELTKTIKLQIPIFDEEEFSQNKVVVGFMLDKKKLEILN